MQVPAKQLWTGRRYRFRSGPSGAVGCRDPGHLPANLRGVLPGERRNLRSMSGTRMNIIMQKKNIGCLGF